MLARQIVNRYHEENVVLSSHLIAYTAFNIIKELHPSLDLYGILRLPKEDCIIPKELFYKNVENLRQQLVSLNQQGKVRLSSIVESGSVEDLVKHGIDNIGIFHVQKALFFHKKDAIGSENLNLLLYYHNRMKGYQLADYIDVTTNK